MYVMVHMLTAEAVALSTGLIPMYWWLSMSISESSAGCQRHEMLEVEGRQVTIVPHHHLSDCIHYTHTHITCMLHKTILFISKDIPQDTVKIK